MLSKKTIVRSGKQLYFIAAGVAWICLRTISANAQTGEAAQDAKPAWRLLTFEEGRSIVNTAWDQEQPAKGALDCSHLIHSVYKKAGFEYPYDSSFELYDGNEHFVRVKFPHAGDLIVWPGHVGIVVDPLLHSFFSLVSTGLDEQNYEGMYWKSRGAPRFYRYKVQTGAASGATQTAAATPAPPSLATPSHDSPQVKSVNRREATPSVHESPSPSDSAENAALTASSTPSSKRTAVTYIPQGQTELTETPAAFQIPTRIVVGPGSRPPSREEMAESISEVNDASGHVLRTEVPPKVQSSLVIVEQFSVKRVDIKRDHGWALVTVDSKVSISGGATHVKPRREEVRWELRRTDSGWEAIPPQDKTYVAHDVAVKNLAVQLARLAESNSAAPHQEAIRQQESSLARLLSTLLDTQ